MAAAFFGLPLQVLMGQNDILKPRNFYIVCHFEECGVSVQIHLFIQMDRSSPTSPQFECSPKAKAFTIQQH